MRARIGSSHAPFLEYAAVHLEPLRARGEGEPVVRASLAWHEQSPPRERQGARPELARMERIDRDLYRGEGELAWYRIDELPGLHLRFRWDGEHLDVAGDFFYSLSADPVRDRLKRLLYGRRLDALRQRKFTTLLYYMAYYPCFWWLERHRDMHPIHAAGVEIGGGVVVLAGPSGVGKSTLSTGLAVADGARFLSDTFLLHAGIDVRPVREPLLLDDWSRRWLGEGAGLLQAIDWRYCLGRRGFHWPAERLGKGGPARLLLFPRRSARHYVRAVPPARAQGQIGAGNAIVNDLRRYLAYAGVLETLDPSPLALAREKSVSELVQRVPCYEIGLTAEVTRAEATALVSELLESEAGAVDAPERGAAGG